MKPVLEFIKNTEKTSSKGLYLSLFFFFYTMNIVLVTGMALNYKQTKNMLGSHLFSVSLVSQNRLINCFFFKLFQAFNTQTVFQLRSSESAVILPPSLEPIYFCFS